MSLNKINLPPKKSIILWAALHAVLLLVFLIHGGMSISTNLYAILPKTNEQQKLSDVENVVTSRLNSQLTILVGNKDLSSAEHEADVLGEYMSGIAGLKDVQLKYGTGALDDFVSVLHKSRYHFLSPAVKKSLENDNINYLRQNCFFQLNGPFALGNLNYLPEDPFLLASSHLQDFLNSSLLSSNAMSLKDSYLHREYNGRHWIMLTAKTDSSGSEIDIKTNPVASLLEYRENLLLSDPASEIVFSGVPVHSYLAARQSQREISFLSTLSTLFIVVLVLLVFRSFLPLGATFFSILMGILSGLAGVAIIFDEIHIFTIVFGTSLIGITVDYSFHYLTHWAESRLDGKKILNDVIPGISIGLLTTFISYGSFFFCPFPLMRQMALFSLFGLCSSFLTVGLIYPVLPKAKMRTSENIGKAINGVSRLFDFSARLKTPVRIVIVILLTAFLFFGIPRLSISNSVTDYYTMSEQMKAWEMTSREVLDLRSTGIYLTIEGSSLEDCLETSERIQADIDEMISKDVLGSAMGLQQFLPSHKSQQSQYQLVKEKMLPAALRQFIELGFSNTDYKNWLEDFNSREDQFLEKADILKLPIGSLLDTFDAGEVDGSYYLNIMLFDVKDIDSIKSWTNGQNKVFLMNKVNELNLTLEKLSRLSLLIIAASYALIFIVLMFRYPFKKAASIVLIPIAASLIALNIVILLKLPVNLFVIVGLILIPGMGSDYIILLNERKSADPAVYLSILMSLLTTLLSFSLLGMTQLAGGFGITVASGLFAAFFLTILLEPVFMRRNEE
ncbi:MAG: hypothetical protein PQJ46_01380 [Spirochaetales bacterium]|nr:hypothetical protein [Spirochaetales bacterium]